MAPRRVHAAPHLWTLGGPPREVRLHPPPLNRPPEASVPETSSSAPKGMSRHVHHNHGHQSRSTQLCLGMHKCLHPEHTRTTTNCKKVKATRSLHSPAARQPSTEYLPHDILKSQLRQGARHCRRCSPSCRRAALLLLPLPLLRCSDCPDAVCCQRQGVRQGGTSQIQAVPVAAIVRLGVGAGPACKGQGLPQGAVRRHRTQILVLKQERHSGRNITTKNVAPVFCGLPGASSAPVTVGGRREGSDGNACVRHSACAYKATTLCDNLAARTHAAPSPVQTLLPGLAQTAGCTQRCGTLGGT